MTRIEISRNRWYQLGREWLSTEYKKTRFIIQEERTAAFRQWLLEQHGIECFHQDKKQIHLTFRTERQALVFRLKY